MADDWTIRGTWRVPWYCFESECNNLGSGGVRVRPKVGPKALAAIWMEQGQIRIVALKGSVNFNSEDLKVFKQSN